MVHRSDVQHQRIARRLQDFLFFFLSLTLWVLFASMLLWGP